MPFRWLKVQKRSSILRTPQESHEESSVHLFSVGVNPPRPHEPLHVRGPSLGTSLHKCPSPGVSPSLRSNPLCGRRHLDCKLFDLLLSRSGTSPRRQPQSCRRTVLFLDETSLRTRVATPQSRLRMIRRGATEDDTPCSAVVTL